MSSTAAGPCLKQARADAAGLIAWEADVDSTKHGRPPWHRSPGKAAGGWRRAPGQGRLSASFWPRSIHTGDCTITAKIHFNMVADVYLCTALDMPATQSGCPSWETLFLGTETLLKGQTQQVTHTLSMLEFNEGIDPVKILLGHFIECGQKITPGGKSGSWGACGWAAFDIGTAVFGGKVIKAVVDGIKAVDAALRTGIGVKEAYQALKALDGLNPAALANIERTVLAYEREVQAACQAAASAPRRTSWAAAVSMAAAGPPCKFWKLIEFDGQRVYQREDLIRPDYVSPNDNYGRTNLKRMQQGLAPMGPDDQPLNLHHMLQTQEGPIAEVTKKMHLDENYHQLHWKSGTKIPSGIDRSAFEAWKKQYWKDRAKGFGG
ncbi:HNH/ENDO VII family nuclease [Streptomyces sp. NPDC058572]|uniref:HNH/ENDO VII family nuclease n=1 Tax=Streptomyces sp. NPDC058572 TaxID=3346546 RepID=UPI003662E444